MKLKRINKTIQRIPSGKPTLNIHRSGILNKIITPSDLLEDQMKLALIRDILPKIKYEQLINLHQHYA